MNTETTSDFLGACHEARKIVELMPKLPKGMKPGHIHVIDIIYRLQQGDQAVRVSDIGAALHVTNPGITRLVNELVELKAVQKEQSETDRRVFTVSLTATGMKYYRKYLEEYHRTMAQKFSGISEKDMETAARVMHEVYRIMSNGNMELD
ncbi:MAG: MarR family transcriptional regulator [Butyrivibrio sp.]|nr:MarR family transcriptional regulator [Butyrivibrio sp.]